MSNYYSGCQSGCQSGYNTNVIAGNSIDIKISECEAAEVRADVVVDSGNTGEDCNIVRLWGQIKDCNGKPVPNALLKLVKVTCCTTGTQYQGIAHTVSDCEGFYQFDLCYCTGNECYKILVSKAYTGPEQVIQTGGGNCGACTEGGNGYKPCHEYAPIVTPGAAHQCTCQPKPQPQPCPPQPCPPQPCPPQPCPPQPYPPYPCSPYTGGCNR